MVVWKFLNLWDKNKTGQRDLPHALNQKIVEFLIAIPNIFDEDTRKSLIYSAGIDKQLRNQLRTAGTPTQFSQLLVSNLSKYGRLEDGRLALVAILNSAAQQVGSDKRNYCESLIREIQSTVNL